MLNRTCLARVLNYFDKKPSISCAPQFPDIFTPNFLTFQQTCISYELVTRGHNNYTRCDTTCHRQFFLLNILDFSHLGFLDQFQKRLIIM